MPRRDDHERHPQGEDQDDRVRAEDVLPVLDAEEHVLGKRQVDAEDKEPGDDAGVAAEREPPRSTWTVDGGRGDDGAAHAAATTVRPVSATCAISSSVAAEVSKLARMRP